MILRSRFKIFNLVLLLILLMDAYLMHFRNFQSLDERFYYSQADIIELFKSLGPLGRENYFWQETLDLTFLSTDTLLILNGLSEFFRKRRQRWTRNALILCLMPGIFDLFETSGVMILLKSWPARHFLLSEFVMIMTPLKWIAGGVLTIFIVGKWLSQKPDTRDHQKSENPHV